MIVPESLALLAIYACPKVIGLAAAKFGMIPVANLFSSIAPSVMSFTFFACTGHHFPRLAGFFLLPQIGLSALVLMSIGANSFTFKNLLLPSVTAVAGYQGWLLNNSLFASILFDYGAIIKQTSVIAAVALIRSWGILHRSVKTRV